MDKVTTLKFLFLCGDFGVDYGTAAPSLTQGDEGWPAQEMALSCESYTDCIKVYLSREGIRKEPILGRAAGGEQGCE